MQYDPWYLAVLCSAEFVVLNPGVGLNDFCCGEESQNRNVSSHDHAVGLAEQNLASSCRDHPLSFLFLCWYGESR